jgi:cell division protein FtsL
MKDKQPFRIVLIAALILIIASAAFFILKQRNQIYEMSEQWDLEKNELSDEYNNLSLQYEGVKQNISSDSLITLVENEQMKVQRLMEELRTVKATNARRIAELKRELKTLREIMRGYVVQIDSLNSANRQLTREKEQATIKYQQAAQAIDQLSQEKSQLNERVSLASRLDASGISVVGINSKNKTEKKIRKMDQLLISFHINKNVTAPTGEKMIYVRIKKPDDDVLVKNRSNVFTYENREINYSSKRLIEYAGEEIPVPIYWKIEEFLSPGTYRVDIFADGNLIGSQSFRLED